MEECIDNLPSLGVMENRDGHGCVELFNKCRFHGKMLEVCDEEPVTDFKVKSVWLPDDTVVYLYDDEHF